MNISFGPAFPTDNKPGMTLLDYIATAALQSVIQTQPGLAPENAASLAMKYADAVAKELGSKRNIGQRPVAGAG